MVSAQYYLNALRVGIRLRAAVVSLLYKKALRISCSSRQAAGVGEVLNLMSNDVEKVLSLSLSRSIDLSYASPSALCLQLQLFDFCWTAHLGLACAIQFLGTPHTYSYCSLCLHPLTSALSLFSPDLDSGIWSAFQPGGLERNGGNCRSLRYGSHQLGPRPQNLHSYVSRYRP